MQKYSGCGNTFFLLDNREKVFPYASIASLCKDVDGMILLEPSAEKHMHKMRIFNRDGSEAEMCGNGVRCFVKFLADLGIVEKKYVIETLAGKILAWLQGDEVVVKMIDPFGVQWDQTIDVEGKPLIVHALNTGVPHAVIFTDDVDAIPIQKMGPEVRHHPFFGKEGTNATFVQCLGNNRILIRTYERGVEGETLACGTGATAAALATSKKFNYSSPMTVYLRSKERLLISFIRVNEQFTEVTMQGSAKKLSIL